MPPIKKARFFFRFMVAIFKKQSKNILLGLLLGIFFYFATPFILKYLPKPKTVFKTGMVGQYEINKIPESILDEISIGLTSLSEKGEVFPELAESWEVENEGKTFRFKITNNEIYWHDGKKFVPSDINYNFKEITLTQNGQEIIFELKEPFAPFLSVVSKPIFKNGLIGLGDYKVGKIEKNGRFIKSILLVPANKGSKYLPVKLYKFYPTETDLKTAFNLGEIDQIDNLSNLEGINQGRQIMVEEKMRSDAYLALFIDNTKPFLNVKSFRQALAYAIPKEEGEKRAIGPLNPFSWAYNPDIKPYLQDTARAKSLLEKDMEGLSNLNITIKTFPEYEKLAKVIMESWEKIGIKSNVQITSFRPSEFDVLLIAREIPSEPDQYSFWHQSQQENITKLDNPRINKLLEDGRKTIDKEQRKDIYYDFQRFLSEESPAIFLTHPTTYSIKRISIFESLM